MLQEALHQASETKRDANRYRGLAVAARTFWTSGTFAGSASCWLVLHGTIIRNVANYGNNYLWVFASSIRFRLSHREPDMRLSLALSIAALALITRPAHAMSCSDNKAICEVRAKNVKNCDGAWKKCMKTGIYIGPESGANHGQAEKR